MDMRHIPFNNYRYVQQGNRTGANSKHNFCRYCADKNSEGMTMGNDNDYDIMKIAVMCQSKGHKNLKKMCSYVCYGSIDCFRN